MKTNFLWPRSVFGATKGICECPHQGDVSSSQFLVERKKDRPHSTSRGPFQKSETLKHFKTIDSSDTCGATKAARSRPFLHSRASDRKELGSVNSSPVHILAVIPCFLNSLHTCRVPEPMSATK